MTHAVREQGPLKPEPGHIRVQVNDPDLTRDYEFSVETADRVQAQKEAARRAHEEDDMGKTIRDDVHLEALARWCTVLD